MRQYLIWNLALVFIWSLFSCASEEESRYRVFRYNQPNNITSLDPAFAKSQNNIWAVDHLYDGLVKLDSQMNITPALAKSWKLLDSGKTYEFVLRDDVYFHKDPCFGLDSTRRLVASDVAFSLRRIMDTTVLSPGSWIFEGKLRQDKPFVVVSDTVFRIHLVEPFRPFLGILTMSYCSVLPHEALEYYQDNFRSNPVGTGAYRLRRWIENRGLFLRANLDYYDYPEGGPHLDGIRIDFIGDRKTAYLEFVLRNLDYLSGLEASFVNDLLDKEGQLLPKHQHRFAMSKKPYLNTEYIGINRENLDENHALNDLRIRRALNLAIDRKTMLRNLRNSVGRPALHGFVPNGLPSFDDSSIDSLYYDAAEARLLVEDFVRENGVFDPLEIHVNGDYLDIVTFLAQAWKKVGIPTEITLDQSSLLREGIRRGDFYFFRASWIADYPDAESFLNVFYGGNPAPPNYTRFSDARFDDLYLRSIKTVNDSARYALYGEMNEILLRELPVVFLYYDETAVFYNKSLTGLEVNAFNLLQVDHINKP